MCKLCKKLGRKLLKRKELIDMHNAALEFYAERLITRDEMTEVITNVHEALRRGEWCIDW